MSDKKVPLKEGYNPKPDRDRGYQPTKPSPEPSSPEPNHGYQPVDTGDGSPNEPAPPSED